MGAKTIQTNNGHLTGIQLAILLKVMPTDYLGVDYPDHYVVISVKELLSNRKTLNIPSTTKRVAEGKYVSGEIWKDKRCDVVYLYIGKTPGGKDVVYNLGGTCAQGMGVVEKGTINSCDRAKIFFHKKVHDPFK